MTETVEASRRTDAQEGPIRRRGAGVVVLFTVTAFVGAGLLFVVQPMIARLVLASFGGSATVWSTSSLFFQVLLLLGYLYAHLATRRLGGRWQPPLHLLLLAVPLVVLPVALPADAAPDSGASPVLWLLWVLTLMIGLPFVVVSTTGPLLQRWYSWAGGPRSEDPYFLFAASNLGSFGGLLAYPFVIEPLLSLDQQRALWSWGYVLFAGLTASCGLFTWTRVRRARPVRTADPAGVGSHTLGPAPEPRLSWRVVGRWTVLAFLPSALLLAVTAHISTDIAAIPLLWVVPLAIYLATFVAAFARTSREVPRAVVPLAVASTFTAVIASLLLRGEMIWVDVALNLVMLTLVSYACHAALAASRPPVQHLTGYYLVVAVGGALGGVLNGVVAPLVFDRVLEYPLVAVLVPLVLLPAAAVSGSRATRWVRAVNRSIPVVLAVDGAVLLAKALDLAALWGVGLVAGLTALFAWLAGRRRREAALVLTLFFVVLTVVQAPQTLERSRTFYGSYRVWEESGLHSFSHGTTLHGTQFQDERRSQPTSYFARSGPLGDVFASIDPDRVAVVGLGAGTIAAYGREGQAMTFIEIDPEVVRIARDGGAFTYLSDTPADVEVLVGDGRLRMSDIPEGSLDLLILDAFSSDAIPVHLLTHEAMQVYGSRMRPGGVIAVHISNRVFDLRPVVRAGALSLDQEAVWRMGRNDATEVPSLWTVIGTPEVTQTLRNGYGWQVLDSAPVRWTDDYSSILSVLR